MQYINTPKFKSSTALLNEPLENSRQRHGAHNNSRGGLEEKAVAQFTKIGKSGTDKKHGWVRSECAE